MKINRSLNLVIPVTDDDSVLYVHSTPIGREVFERYYLIISKVFAAIYSEGLNVVAGPRVAYLVLKELAKKGGPAAEQDVQNGLIAEIRRLTNVCVMNPTGGWEVVPFQSVIDRQMLDDDTIAEVESAIVFFIVNSALHKRGVLTTMLEMMVDLFGWRLTSSNVTEYLSSLPTSTATVNTGETVIQSSIPH
jgi:hypothetical protein